VDRNLVRALNRHQKGWTDRAKVSYGPAHRPPLRPTPELHCVPGGTVPAHLSQSIPEQNLLLNSLSPEVRQRIFSYLQACQSAVGAVLDESGSRMVTFTSTIDRPCCTCARAVHRRARPGRQR